MTAKHMANGSTRKFAFEPDVEPFVDSLMKLMYFANAKDCGKWAWQSRDLNHEGVYGYACRTMLAVVREQLHLHGIEQTDEWYERYNHDEFSAASLEYTINAWLREKEQDAIYERYDNYSSYEYSKGRDPEDMEGFLACEEAWGIWKCI